METAGIDGSRCPDACNGKSLHVPAGPPAPGGNLARAERKNPNPGSNRLDKVARTRARPFPKASLVHNATGYFGHAMADRRLAAAFFWMAD